ncbi:septal ring lytic transglycosylase RlpA family protein [Dactylosporangium sp. CS-033363]|uniref:septal ring lytic transglycosylase RlpA family protein n=1 Tax=Dactylosporangium sp. CS-033363 TaxID=3239935 RepID=UPI003D8CE690
MQTLSGRHSLVSRRHLIPMIAGVAAVVALVGGAVATMNMGGDDPKSAAAVDAQRSPQDRADRGERPSPSAQPSLDPAQGVESGLTSTSASPTPSKTPSKSKTPTKSPTTKAPAEVASSGTCEVSYYADGQKTANGENFDPNGLTAAHKTLKFGTIVRVTNLANGKSVDVRINDRGPFVAGRCLDLAKGAFVKIASVSAGVIDAKYEVLK